MRRLLRCGGAIVLTALLFNVSVQAQSFAVDRQVISGGGGSSSGGPFTVSGTIGQWGAGSESAGGSFAVQGGYWSGYIVVQNPGAPTLSITRIGGSVEITWPAAGTESFDLQRSSSVGASSMWMLEGAMPIVADGVIKVVLPNQSGIHFFRLTRPQ